MGDDSIFVLREFVIADRLDDIVEDGKDLVFKDKDGSEKMRVPMDKKTVYKNQSGQMIPILAAVLLVRNSTSHVAYVRACAQRGAWCHFAASKERQGLLDFLHGAAETCGGIPAGKYPTAASGDAPAAKRARTDAAGAGGGGGGGAAATAASAPETAKTSSSRAPSEKKRAVVEIRMKDRNSVLVSPGNDFTFALKYHKDLHDKSKEAASRASKAKDGRSGTKRSSSGDPKSGGKADRRSSGGSKHGGSAGSDTRLPIIIVPTATSAMVTLFNVKSFLQDGVFETTEAKRAEDPTKPQKVKITRRITGESSTSEAEYEVIDSPLRLSSTDWERVVAVFAMGKDWQFKGWKWPTAVDVFNNCLGVYLQYNDVLAPPEAIQKWNVTVLDLSKTRRHLDRTTSLHFWRLLDEFVRQHKREFVRT